jgi:hypothetical protein
MIEASDRAGGGGGGAAAAAAVPPSTQRKVWKPRPVDPSEAGALPSLFAAASSSSSSGKLPVTQAAKRPAASYLNKKPSPSPTLLTTMSSPTKSKSKSVGHILTAPHNAAPDGPVGPPPAFRVAAVAAASPMPAPRSPRKTTAATTPASSNTQSGGVPSLFQAPTPSSAVNKAPHIRTYTMKTGGLDDKPPTPAIPAAASSPPTRAAVLKAVQHGPSSSPRKAKSTASLLGTPTPAGLPSLFQHSVGAGVAGTGKPRANVIPDHTANNSSKPQSSSSFPTKKKSADTAANTTTTTTTAVTTATTTTATARGPKVVPTIVPTSSSGNNDDDDDGAAACTPLPVPTPEAIAAARAILATMPSSSSNTRRPVDPSIPIEIAFDPSSPHDIDDDDFELASTAYSAVASGPPATMEELLRHCCAAPSARRDPPKPTTGPVGRSSTSPGRARNGPPAVMVSPLSRREQEHLMRDVAAVAASPAVSPSKRDRRPRRSVGMAPLSPLEQKELLSSLLARRDRDKKNSNDENEKDDDDDDEDSKRLELSTIDPRELDQTDKVRRAIMMAANGGAGSVSSEMDRAERRQKQGLVAGTGTPLLRQRDIEEKMDHFFSTHRNGGGTDDDDDDVEISSCETDSDDDDQ